MKITTLFTPFILSVITSSLCASELVYTPINPSFGGNPLNSSHLINLANSQNDYKDPDLSGRDKKSSLEDFNDRLQRSILSRLTSVLSSSIVGSNGQVTPGSFETTDFVINVEDLGGDSMRITTTDKVTGDETVFEISTAL